MIAPACQVRVGSMTVIASADTVGFKKRKSATSWAVEMVWMVIDGGCGGVAVSLLRGVRAVAM